MMHVAEAKMTRDGDCLAVTVPLRLKRRAGRKEIIAPAGTEDPSDSRTSPNQALALTIARAHRWEHLLESGRYTTIGELARDVGVDNSYLARMLRLTLLSPDIIQAILNGTEPDDISLEKLYRMPVLWEEQRQLLNLALQQPTRVQ